MLFNLHQNIWENHEYTIILVQLRSNDSLKKENKDFYTEVSRKSPKMNDRQRTPIIFKVRILKLYPLNKIKLTKTFYHNYTPML